MIRITITPAAYAAIAATLPSSVGVEKQRSPNGHYYIWLEPRYVDRLRVKRRAHAAQRLDPLSMSSTREANRGYG
jgi:hypothetical protein